MARSSHSPSPRSARRRALLRYTAAWAVTGAIIALGVVTVVSGDDDEVRLPPVRQTELRQAARDAGCELRAGAVQRMGDPPVAGPRARAAAPGFYEEAMSGPALVGAMRRGQVVVHYSRQLPEQERDLLKSVQRAVPEGTVVVPNDRMRFALAVTAWRRLLGCARVGPGTLDAVRLFRGRFLGSGPDSPL